MRFIEDNAHPKHKKTDDCVVRALALAEGKRWIEVYEELCALGREMFEMPNMKAVYERYLLERGWIKMPMPKKWDNTRFTIKEWADENPNRVMVIRVAKHLTTVIHGDLHDTWNCGRKCVGNYYIK